MKYSGFAIVSPGCGSTPNDTEYGLALSGSGYRAMLYPAGTMWRLHELSRLEKMDNISRVSRGSVTAAQLGLHWRQLIGGGDFKRLIADPLLKLNKKSIDIAAVLIGMLPGTCARARVASHYDQYPFEGKVDQEFPDPATGAPVYSVPSNHTHTGKLAKVHRNGFYHYPQGDVPGPAIPASVAVASSSALPPFLSPNTLKFKPGSVKRIHEDRDIGNHSIDMTGNHIDTNTSRFNGDMPACDAPWNYRAVAPGQSEKSRNST